VVQAERADMTALAAQARTEGLEALAVAEAPEVATPTVGRVG